jgi:hypothetical protein
MRPPVRERTGVGTWWKNVSLVDPVAAQTMRRLLDEALIWLAKDECENILDDFSDDQGRTPRDNLPALSSSISQHMARLYFLDASGSMLCSRGAFAFTARGSRVVWICGRTLEESYARSPRHATASVIHEVLHTLGLGENPPTSAEITAHVLRHCGHTRP